MESTDQETKCLNALRTVLHERIPEYETMCGEETRFLLRFVHARKYDSKRAAKMLSNYLDLRHTTKTKQNYIPIPSTMKPILDIGMHVILRKRDAFGRKIFLFRTELWDPHVISLDDIIVATFLLLEEMVDSDKTQESGIVLVVDMTGLCWGQISHATPSRIKQIVSVLQGNFPLKCKGLHSVNDPYWLSKILSFAKPFFTEKLQKRVHFHGKNLNSFHTLIPEGVLPRDLGGMLSWEDATDNKLMQRLYSREDYYAKWHALKTAY